jgi:hypothetical protein
VFGISRSELRIFLERSLKKREKELLLECFKLQGYTFSALVKKLAGRGYPESTAKVVLRRLKFFGLIDIGDIKNKGRPLNFTVLGRNFLKILKREGG